MSPSRTHTATPAKSHILAMATCEHCNNRGMSPNSVGDLAQYSDVIAQNAASPSGSNVRTNQQSPDSPRTAASPFMLGPPLPSADLQLDSETDMRILQFHREQVVPLIFRPRCHLVYHSALSKNHYGFQFPPLKNALLATTAIRLASQRSEYHTLAAGYYGKAVQGLKQALDGGHVTGTEDFFLETVSWLGFYETKIPGHLRNAAAHFSTSVNLFGTRRRTRRCKCQHQLLEKLLAETTLFACSTLALFDSAIAAIPLSSLRDNIGPVLSELQAPTKSHMVDSPFLGLPAELYFLMFEVSQQYHRDATEALSTTLQTQDLCERLRRLDHLAGTGSPDPLYEPHMQAGSYDTPRVLAYRLHVKACLALVTFWLQREIDGPTFNPEGLLYLQQGMGMLTVENLAEIGRSYDVTWPIKTMGGMLRSRLAIGALRDVLGHAARYEGGEQFGGALEQLSGLWAGKQI